MPRLLLLFTAVFVALASRPYNEAPADHPPAEAVAHTDAKFEEVMRYARAQRLSQEPFGVIVQKLGERFRGTPYVAGVLDAPEDETLLAPLDKFDCVLFVESMLALARGVQAEDYSYEGYLRRVQEQRYRGGEMNGYCSRLHYFSDWIRDNERRGLVENVTQRIGGSRLEKTIDFMSKHRGSYPRLVASDSLFEGIVQTERDLADLDLYYIPQNRIRSVYNRLQPGDIIATATNIGGLDVTHTGFVYRSANGQTGFLHASTKNGVTIAQDLQAYLEGNRSQIGIVVARPKG